MRPKEFHALRYSVAIKGYVRVRPYRFGRDLASSLALRREVRAQYEFALQSSRLETAMRLGHLIEGDPLGDARPDGASHQEAKETLQVLPEPCGMARPH